MKYELIFKAVVGSQAYGLATETSDEDIKGVYIQPEEDFLQADKYVPYLEVNKDECYYELRNFLGLLAVGNPTALELLATPKECVLFISPKFEEILSYRAVFITKKVYDSFGGYANAQIKKAKGLDKKFNWEKSRTESRDIMDFCMFLGREEGKVEPIKQKLNKLKVSQSNIGLTKIAQFRDSYKVYVGVSENYRGIMKEGSNSVRVSEIPKDLADDWIGTLYFNREAYSTHCKDYKSYLEWKKSRNEARYRESREGQQYDSKNIMHTVRLIITIESIHKSGFLDIDMSEYRKELLDIKFGRVNLEEVFNEYVHRASKIKELKEESYFPEEVSMDFVNKLELIIRKYGK